MVDSAIQVGYGPAFTCEPLNEYIQKFLLLRFGCDG